MILLNVEGRSKSTLPPHELQVLHGFFPYALKVCVVQIDVKPWLAGAEGRLILEGIAGEDRPSSNVWEGNKMKFLFTTELKFQPPLEALPGLFDAGMAWAEKYQKEGKLEIVWSRVGGPGSGGIANVDSLEELDAMMAESPMAAFFEVHIVPITDLKASLERTKQTLQARARARG
jgi:muconolactone delta-isomerase